MARSEVHQSTGTSRSAHADPLEYLEQHDGEETAWRRNCSSVSVLLEKIAKVFDDQARRGQASKLTEEGARWRLPNLIVASLGAKQQNKPGGIITAEVLFDGTNWVTVNHRTRIRDQERASIAWNVKRYMKEKMEALNKTLALNADVAWAHRQVPFAERDRHRSLRQHGWYVRSLLSELLLVSGGVFAWTTDTVHIRRAQTSQMLVATTSTRNWAAKAAEQPSHPFRSHGSLWSAAVVEQDVGRGLSHLGVLVDRRDGRNDARSDADVRRRHGPHHVPRCTNPFSQIFSQGSSVRLSQPSIPNRRDRDISALRLCRRTAFPFLLVPCGCTGPAHRDRRMVPSPQSPRYCTHQLVTTFQLGDNAASSGHDKRQRRALIIP